MDGGSVSRPKTCPRRSSARLNGSTPAAAAVASGSKVRSAAAAAATAAAAGAAAAAARRARAAERAREVEDSPRELRRKCRRLARALRDAKHLVVYTGAGISTAAAIPDYRGPRGVWTRLRRGERVACDVAAAAPTYAHMALTALWRRGLVKFVVSQNCDGLHLRAGLPRAALAELHGDMFAERCAACRRVYLRAFDTTRRTARHAHGTRRLCHACGAELRDSIVHFGERGSAAWPLNWAGALRHAAAADVVLCLGSSLKVLRRYPRLWSMQRRPRRRPRLYIVNLQWTPKDAGAALKINARCDAVLAQVARRLRVRVPRYRASRDPLLAHAEPLLAAERHTAPRLLRPPPEPSDSDSGDCEPASDDDSGSDSDDDLVPLRRLAERLRAAPAASAPSATSALSASSAPSATSASSASSAPSATSASSATSTTSASSATSATSAPSAASAPEPLAPPPRPRHVNGYHINSNGLCSFQVKLSSGGVGAHATILLRAHHAPPPEPEPPPSAPPPSASAVRNGCCLPAALNGSWDAKPKLEPPDIKSKLKCSPMSERAAEAEAAAEAAAAVRRALLLVRAGAWGAWGAGGLAAVLRGACAWCWRERRAARCLWYGPPRSTPPERRAWRAAPPRLCACCPGAPPPPGSAAPPPAQPGWFGKGCRKGRR